MRRPIFICLFFCFFIISCQSNSNPDTVALKFTRSFFVGIAHSRNSDFSTNSDLLSEALKPFEKGMCTQDVYSKIRNFYEQPIYPALQWKESFFANDHYKIMASFNEGSEKIYEIAAMNLTKKDTGSSKMLLGLRVTVDTSSGKNPTVTDFKYGFVYHRP